MSVYEIDPRVDLRWAALVESHPRSSVFHTTPWLESLRRTYGYTATVLTTTPAGSPLTNGIVFCKVNSWLTGTRLVSLPFSDHCDPLVRNAEDLDGLLAEVKQKTQSKIKYTDIRPRFVGIENGSGFRPLTQFYLHALQLHPDLEELHSRLHKDSTQRKIRRAQREGVVLVQGQSDTLLVQFYDLLVLTRRRHMVPPQPIAWFRNLVEMFGDRLTIRVARVGDRPIASILTLRHKDTVVYKYGCSDAQFHNLGGIPFLFWKTIQEAKSEQLRELDLGRSEPENAGLIRFKDHLGAEKTCLSYVRFSHKVRESSEEMAHSQRLQRLVSHLPDSLFRLAGEMLYRHVG